MYAGYAGIVLKADFYGSGSSLGEGWRGDCEEVAHVRPVASLGNSCVDFRRAERPPVQVTGAPDCAQVLPTAAQCKGVTTGRLQTAISSQKSDRVWGVKAFFLAE